MPRPGWFLRRKLKRAISLFQRVLELNPRNWSALWLIGKVHQRLGDQAAALSAFERAYQINPRQPDIAREASMSATEIGRTDAAILFGLRATEIEPANAGLHANLALTYLLAARLAEAQASINRSLALDPNDKISKTIATAIEHFVASGHAPPSSTRELSRYVDEHLQI